MKKKARYLLFSMTVLAVCLLGFATNAFAAETVLPTGAGQTYATIQDAVDHIEALPDPGTPTTYVVELSSGTYSTAAYIHQQANKNIVLRPASGAVAHVTQTLYIDGMGRSSAPETILVEGIDFDLSGTPVTSSSDACILSYTDTTQGDHYSYPHNITVQDCTFEGDPSLDRVAVKIGSGKSGSGKNLTIDGCEANSVHSLAQLSAMSGTVLITDTTSTGGGGVNIYGNDLDLKIQDSTITAGDSYAVRLGQGSPAPVAGFTATVTGSTLQNSSAMTGTIVLRGTSAGSVTVNESVLLNTATSGAVLQNLLDESSSAQVATDFNDNYWGTGGYFVPGLFASTSAPVDTQSKYEATKRYHIILSYDANGGVFTDGSATKTDESYCTVDITAPTAPAYALDCTYLPGSDDVSRSGYTLAGWYTAATGGSQITMGTSGAGNALTDKDATIYAQWTENKEPDQPGETTVTPVPGNDAGNEPTVTPVSSTDPGTTSGTTPDTGDDFMNYLVLLVLTGLSSLGVGTRQLCLIKARA